jgi:hypothetical protein
MCQFMPPLLFYNSRSLNVCKKTKRKKNSMTHVSMHGLSHDRIIFDRVPCLLLLGISSFNVKNKHQHKILICINVSRQCSFATFFPSLLKQFLISLLNVCMYVCMSLCMYVCTYVCMYDMHTYIHTLLKQFLISLLKIKIGNKNKTKNTRIECVSMYNVRDVLLLA